MVEGVLGKKTEKNVGIMAVRKWVSVELRGQPSAEGISS